MCRATIRTSSSKLARSNERAIAACITDMKSPSKRRSDTPRATAHHAEAEKTHTQQRKRRRLRHRLREFVGVREDECLLEAVVQAMHPDVELEVGVKARIKRRAEVGRYNRA